ncbi:pentapeptide repeat-containing protein [Desulfospira joergensenii]|uniref:pentapeptide repeat-containing protein n=1 Tax=Desulfospira joergensenii TaxID=53329 RepID=UPI0004271059|nr:pentapeptide repeat-containing protein [Desulfospira joergensenii]
MANQNHLDIIKQGVNVWNKWRDDNKDIKPDLNHSELCNQILSGANFNASNLNGSNLDGADLSGVNLKGAFLNETMLRKTILMDANLEKANLNKAILKDVDLRRAKLTGAQLNGANLNDSISHDADFSRASLCKTFLQGANLRDTVFLDANLTLATLSDANLQNANFTNANLSWADLFRTKLNGTIFNHAKLEGANLREANLIGANFKEASLYDVNLRYAQMADTNFEDANLTGCKIFGSSAWGLRLKGTVQNNLSISKQDQPAVCVDSLEVAQFIYLLLRHENLKNVFNSMTQKGVLILGRFGGGGIETLRACAAKLREMKYLPMIFDFERPRDRNYTETVKTLVGLSRFVITDLSGPSVPNELATTVPFFKIPFVPILEEGKREYSMFVDIMEYDWVLKPIVKFKTIESLIELLPLKIVKPAEKRIEKRQKILDELIGRGD